MIYVDVVLMAILNEHIIEHSVSMCVCMSAHVCVHVCVYVCLYEYVYMMNVYECEYSVCVCNMHTCMTVCTASA